MTQNKPQKNPYETSQLQSGETAQSERSAHALAHNVEPMIDAKQAAAALRLPYYWFADQAMRSKYRIPHYLMGGLIRYRLSELSAWAARSTVARGRDVQGQDAHDVSAPVEVIR